MSTWSSRSDDNLGRLAVALKELGAQLRTADGPIAAPLDAEFLAAMPLMVNLTNYKIFKKPKCHKENALGRMKYENEIS